MPTFLILKMKASTIQRLQDLVLGEIPFRTALVECGVPVQWMRLKHRFEYNRLMRLARAVKAAGKGATLREVCRIARVQDTSIAVVYPTLYALCKRNKRSKGMARVAAVCEVLATCGYESLKDLACDMGETDYTVNSAWVKYYGMEEANQYGLRSKV